MKKTFLVLCAINCFISTVLAESPRSEPGPPVESASPVDSGYAVDPVAFPSVRFKDAFWAPRQTINREKSIPYAFEQCEKTGRVSNFWLAANIAPLGTKYVEPIFNDTDIYKGIEAASFDLALHPNPELARYVDRLISIVRTAQESDGYLYSAISKERDFSQTNPLSVGKRWHGLRWSHELYCAGHLYESAVAHYISTGKRNFLDVACKNADLLCQTFGPNEGQIVDVPGHEIVEMGLVKLYRVTGEKKYLDLAKFFVEMRGRKDKRNSLSGNPRETYGQYAQDDCPLSEENEAVGHAVRAVYYYEGAADVAALTRDQSIVDSIKRIWDNAVGKKIYLTGGLGGTAHGEAFSDNYVLSNFSGYSETCAQIGGCGWHQRMFWLDPDAKYYDVIEQTIYNSLISGVSLSGDAFFYPNQLASRGGIRRAPWFGCACCPQNLMRFLASLGGYVYATQDRNLYVCLYMANEAAVNVQGQPVELELTGNYPWSGDIALTVKPKTSGQSFCLNLRVPGWLSEAPFAGNLYQYADGKTFRPTVKVNGKRLEGADSEKNERGFLSIDRAWNTGDRVEISFPMNPRWARADERVKACRNRIALTRGPIVYAFESCDNGGHVFDVFVKPTDPIEVGEYDSALLKGVCPIRVKGYCPEWTPTGAAGVSEPICLTAIPYCVWANREDGPMQVWMADSAAAASGPKRPTIANQAKIYASFDRGRNATMDLNSIADGEYPGDDSENETYRNFDFWPRRNSTEWVQYDFERQEEVSAIQVMWFNDSARGGGCNVPKQWKIWVQTESGAWVEPSNVSGYPTDSETMLTVTFDKIKAKAMKLEVQLQEKWSAGLYEWSVE